MVTTCAWLWYSSSPKCWKLEHFFIVIKFWAAGLGRAYSIFFPHLQSLPLLPSFLEGAKNGKRHFSWQEMVADATFYNHSLDEDTKLMLQPVWKPFSSHVLVSIMRKIFYVALWHLYWITENKIQGMFQKSVTSKLN